MTAGRLRWPDAMPRTTRPVASDGPRWLVAESGTLRAPWRLALFAGALFGAMLGAQWIVYPLVDTVAQLAGVRVVAWPWLLLLAAFVAHVLVLRQVESREWSDVALGGSAWRARPLGRGLLLGGAAIGAVAATLLAAGALHLEPAADGSAIALALRLLLTLAPAALFEELAFRGYLWHVAEEAAGAYVALFATSVAFAMVHVINPGATPLSIGIVFAAGLALGAVRQVTRSLPAAWLAHVAWNMGLAAGLHAPVSGLPFEAVGWRVVPNGPAWLTGGAWGPEGSLVTALVFAVGGHLLWHGGFRMQRASSRAASPASTSSS